MDEAAECIEFSYKRRNKKCLKFEYSAIGLHTSAEREFPWRLGEEATETSLPSYRWNKCSLIIL